MCSSLGYLNLLISLMIQHLAGPKNGECKSEGEKVQLSIGVFMVAVKIMQHLSLNIISSSLNAGT